jgi:hypothetical protein
MKATLRTLTLALLVACSLPSHATDTVVVTNAAQLSWFYDATSGRVYFRNFDQFTPGFLGCCFNFYIDTSTQLGRTFWAAILLKMAGAQPINLIVDSKGVAGPVYYGGNW